MKCDHEFDARWFRTCPYCAYERHAEEVRRREDEEDDRAEAELQRMMEEHMARMLSSPRRFGD